MLNRWPVIAGAMVCACSIAAFADDAPPDGADLGQTTVEGLRISEAEAYRVESSNTATHTDTPIFDLPLSIQVIPKQVLEDQAAKNVYEGLRNVSGVHQNKGVLFNSADDGGVIRGFQSTVMYYNGFLIEAAGALNVPNMERIEVLKGPSGMLYGVVEPGGIINVVTKKPEAEQRASIHQQFGSYDTYRSTVDVTGPLNDEGTVLYRVNGGYYNEESFRDYVEEERYWVSPSITIKPMRETTITFDFSYGERNRTLDEGVAFGANGKPIAPIDTFLGEPGLPGQEQRDIFFGVHLEHELNDHVTLRSGLLLHHWDIDINGVRRSTTNYVGTTVARLYDDSDFTEDSVQWHGEAQFDFDLGPTKHKLLTGVDVRWRNQSIDLKRAGYTPIDIINPVYGDPLPATPYLLTIENDRTWAGIYVQDQISLLPDDRLKLMLGGRFDWVESVASNTNATPVETDREDHELTGRGGLMFDLTEWAAIYGSVSQSFVPTSTTSSTFDGDLLDPEEGLQYEAGLKFLLFNERVLATMAVYELTKDNVAVADPNNPGFSINGGELRSRGFEFDVAGNLGGGWSIIGNYTYTDTKVIESDSLPVGARFINVPNHSGSVWIKYVMPDGDLKGLGFGAGVFAASNRSGDNNDSFQIPRYARVDVGVFYDAELPSGQTLHAQLNVKNLFNEEYYESSFGVSRVFPGDPLTVVLTLGIDF